MRRYWYWKCVVATSIRNWPSFQDCFSFPAQLPMKSERKKLPKFKIPKELGLWPDPVLILKSLLVISVLLLLKPQIKIQDPSIIERRSQKSSNVAGKKKTCSLIFFLIKSFVSIFNSSEADWCRSFILILWMIHRCCDWPALSWLWKSCYVIPMLAAKWARFLTSPFLYWACQTLRAHFKLI